MGTFMVFDHTADVGLDVSGQSEEDLFATATRAMFDQTLEDWPTEVECQKEIISRPPVGMEGDLAELLMAWLQELLYVFDTEHLAPLKEEFDAIGPKDVRASVEFGRFDPTLHRTRAEIKAVTYHEFDVHREPDGTWKARFILDV